MKVCVFSDIHGNQFSFEAALPLMLADKADVHYFLGDLCGYYFNQIDVFDLLKTLPNLIAILGNHDQMFLQIAAGDDRLLTEYTQRYGRSMVTLLEHNFKELRAWLKRLPHFNINEDIDCYACHGNPLDNLKGYVYPDTDLNEFMCLQHALFLTGHTHYPMARTVNGKLFVNPGSIGQPRHGGPPTYAVIDTKRKKVTFKEVHYDKEKLVDQVRQLDRHNQYLTNVIRRDQNNA